MKMTSFKGSKFNLKRILPTQAQEFQCHLQKSYGVRATETQKWPFHYQREKYDTVEFVTSLKLACQNFKATNGWRVKYMYCKGLLLCSRTTLVHRLP
jgi:Pyruvate/2-oxoacid:ferredoxin oxidoreductase delta subunit